jgi:serine/threonine-protein kinase HipA
MNTSIVARASAYLNDRYVGSLQYKDGYGSFKYEDLEPDHPVLGLRFEYDPDYASNPEVSIPKWFVNLLPERGSGLRVMYSRQLGRSDVSDFLLLMYLGHDLPGAIRVEADGALPVAMARALEKANVAQGGANISFSLSGMQVKYSMREDGEGFTVPAIGELGDWIVKLPSSAYPRLPENEYSMMTWASAAGIDVPDHRLVTGELLRGLPNGQIEKGEIAYAVRRFDRTSTLRIHQEDFAQILDLPPAQKDRGSQELVGEVLLNECPEIDFQEYIRRLVFCVVSGNTDEHLKNWSLRYPDMRSARLSPAYDLAAATSYPQLQYSKLTLPIAGQDDTRLITLRYFQEFSENLSTDVDVTTSVVRDTIQRLKVTWPTISNDPQTPEFVKEHVDNRVRYLPLMQD